MQYNSATSPRETSIRDVEIRRWPSEERGYTYTVFDGDDMIVDLTLAKARVAVADMALSHLQQHPEIRMDAASLKALVEGREIAWSLLREELGPDYQRPPGVDGDGNPKKRMIEMGYVIGKPKL